MQFIDGSDVQLDFCWRIRRKFLDQSPEVRTLSDELCRELQDFLDDERPGWRADLPAEPKRRWWSRFFATLRATK